MIKNYFRSLFLMAMICIGTNAWGAAGDVVTNADIDFSNEISDGVVVGNVNTISIGGSSTINDGWLRLIDATSTVTIPEEERAGAKDIVTISFDMAWGNKNKMGSGFRLVDEDGEYIATFQMARWDGGNTNANTLNIVMGSANATGSLWGNHYSNKPIAARSTHFDISVNYATGVITSIVSCAYHGGSETFTADLTNNKSIAKLELYGYGVGSNTDRASIVDNILIKTTEGNYDVSEANYTINWVFNGETLKSETRLGEIGTVIRVTDADKSAFYIDETKYFYVSDDAEGKTITENGSTVVTINLREAEYFAYTVNAVADENSMTLATGSVIEGESVSISYPRYVNFDGTLYQKAANNSNYHQTVAPTENNFVANWTYTATDITDIVYYTEGEWIPGVSSTSSGNISIRASNGAGGYIPTNGSDAEMTTLEPGIYTFNIMMTTPNGARTFTFLIGEETKSVTSQKQNLTSANIENIIITASTLVKLAKGSGDSNNGLDYIYIQKTGDIPASTTATIGSTGYATFCSEFPLDLTALPEGLSAYYVTAENVTAEDVTLTAATTAVAAGEGLILAGSAGSYDIPVAAAGTAIDGNALVGVLAESETLTQEEGYTKYVMVKLGDDAKFQYIGSTSATVAKGKAYIKVAESAGPEPAGDDMPGVGDENNVKSLNIHLPGETTAMRGIEAGAQFLDGNMFNLAGQRVDNNYRGIVIKNGKKYLVK